MVVGDILATHFSNHAVDWISVGSQRCQSLIDISLTLFKMGSRGVANQAQGASQVQAQEDLPDESYVRQALAQWSIIFSRVIANGMWYQEQRRASLPPNRNICLIWVNSSFRASE